MLMNGSNNLQEYQFAWLDLHNARQGPQVPVFDDCS